MQNESERNAALLKITGDLLNAIVAGLSQVDAETMKRIMESCGETCAREELYGPALEIAKRIAEQEVDEEKALDRANKEILWCGRWVRSGDTIQCTCSKCGCLLVQNGIVKLNGTFCHCSRGWVKTIFETLFKKPVRVELEKAIGKGDDVCKYVVYL